MQHAEDLLNIKGKGRRRFIEKVSLSKNVKSFIATKS